MLGEADQPSFGLAVASIERAEILNDDSSQSRSPRLAEWKAHLIVNVDTIKAVLLDPSRHGIGGGNWIGVGSRRDVGGAKRGHEKLDAGVGVLGLDGGALARS